MSRRGLKKRVKSPTSATSTTAMADAIPRIAYRHHPPGAGSFRDRAEYLFLDLLQAPFRIHDGIDVVLNPTC
ncbi:MULTISPECIES: hypothetical protein [Mesorhizobium]|uniref:hypothetical protein n=1 Tax=Mesorhizobium TaxID=68287 RepID=UPI0001B743BC|nr:MULTISPECIES: hypothetical protein [Mesorhizobium]